MPAYSKPSCSFMDLPAELRHQIYEDIYGDERDALLSTMAISNLQDALLFTKPLLAMDNNGVILREALISWLRTRKVIIEGTALDHFEDCNRVLKGYGINVCDEVRRAEVWAWCDEDLDVAAHELRTCTGLTEVAVLLGDGLDTTAAEAMKMFSNLHGEYQLRIYEEWEHIEMDNPLCQKIVNISARNTTANRAST